MTIKEAREAVKQDIKDIADSDDKEDRLSAMVVGFSDLLVNQTIAEHQGEATEKELAVYAMAATLKALIDLGKLDKGVIYTMFVKLKMKSSKHYFNLPF